jgi:hypothetical protein
MARDRVVRIVTVGVLLVATAAVLWVTRRSWYATTGPVTFLQTLVPSVVCVFLFFLVVRPFFLWISDKWPSRRFDDDADASVGNDTIVIDKTSARERQALIDAYMRRQELGDSQRDHLSEIVDQALIDQATLNVNAVLNALGPPPEPTAGKSSRPEPSPAGVS